MKYRYVKDGLVYFNDETIVRQFVDIIWHSSTKARYVSYDYIFTKIGDVLTIDVTHLPRGSHTKVTVICSNNICGKERQVRFSDVMYSEHSMCNRCANIKNLTGQIFNRLTVLKQSYITNNQGVVWFCRCSCDGRIIEVLSRSLTSGATQSCGCLRDELSRSRCGKNSPNWCDNITDEERDNFRGNDITQWSLSVRLRDNFTCQCCGRRGGDLESHHLNGYKDFPEERLDLDNGVTLCKTCHKDFHSWMGGFRVSCAFDDFVRFINTVSHNEITPLEQDMVQTLTYHSKGVISWVK